MTTATLATVKAEFQLFCQFQGNFYNSPSGKIWIEQGTIVGRLYFPADYNGGKLQHPEMTVLSFQQKGNTKVVYFVAPNHVYLSLNKTCINSNVPKCRFLTEQLIEQIQYENPDLVISMEIEESGITLNFEDDCWTEEELEAQENVWGNAYLALEGANPNILCLPGRTPIDFTKYTVKKLKHLGKLLRVEGTAKMTKGRIVSTLQDIYDQCPIDHAHKIEAWLSA